LGAPGWGKKALNSQEKFAMRGKPPPPKNNMPRLFKRRVFMKGGEKPTKKGLPRLIINETDGGEMSLRGGKFPGCKGGPMLKKKRHRFLGSSLQERNLREKMAKRSSRRRTRKGTDLRRDRLPPTRGKKFLEENKEERRAKCGKGSRKK